MAITTVDGVIAGAKPANYCHKAVTGTMVAGRPFSPFYLAGIPGAAAAPTPGIAGAALTTYAGQVPFPAASGNTYLASLKGSSSAQAGTLILCDRLWHNSGMSQTVTTAQTINSVAWPARDMNGTTNGDGVYVGLEISTATGAGVPTLTLGYTDSAGTVGNTATNTVATVATSAAGTFYPIGLAVGDVGVRSIQTFQLSATWTSGVAHLVAYRPIASIMLPAAGVPDFIDAVSGGLPRCYDGTVPFFIFIPQTTSTTQLNASVQFTQG